MLHGKEEQRRPDSSYSLEDRMERAGDGAAARAVKLVEVLTGKNPRVAPMSDRRIKISDSSSRIDAWRGTRSSERGDREVEQQQVSPGSPKNF